jgi:hypothetical protein
MGIPESRESNPSRPTIPDVPSWSDDARVLVRPAQTYQAIAAGSATSAPVVLRVAAARPFFVLFVIGCAISLVATTVASARLVFAPMIYWSFVPLVEILGLFLVIERARWRARPAVLIDAFFTGHAAWTLLILATAAALSLSTPMHWWFLISGPGVAAVLIVAAWSAYVDFCFFRRFCGSPMRKALGQLALNRFIVWTLVFWIFAVPEPTPLGVFQELVEAVREVLQ